MINCALTLAMKSLQYYYSLIKDCLALKTVLGACCPHIIEWKDWSLVVGRVGHRSFEGNSSPSCKMRYVQVVVELCEPGREAEIGRQKLGNRE